MQLQLSKEILEKSAFDGQFGEAIDTAIKLMDAIHKLRYEDTDTIEMSKLDAIIKEVEKPW